MAAIVGIGQSSIGRDLGRSPLSLTVDACLDALADAGVDRTAIDGVSTWPGNYNPTPGFSGVGVNEIQDALRLRLTWFSGGPETPGQLGAVFNACAAIEAGLASRVLCFRTVWESTAQRQQGRSGAVASDGTVVPPGPFHWLTPFGAASPANWVALMASRHRHRYGLPAEALGAIAVNGRSNASHNPAAVFREPLTMRDYLDSPMVSEPLRRHDCDVPCDGSTAIIVAASARSGVEILSIGSARAQRPHWFQLEDECGIAVDDAASMLWARTDLTPDDVDVAQLYDGFSFLALQWLEALRFCGPGESADFVTGMDHIGLGGSLPLNTGGGQLSAGRLHGFGLLHEACVQLRGLGGDRQIPGRADVAVVSAGGGPLAGCLLLGRA